MITFLSSIYAEGGWENEAIEIELYQANQEEDSSQVILIGDAPANTLEDIAHKRKNFNSTKYNQEIYYENEIRKLKDKKIPYHTLYVAKKAEINFKYISEFTGGKSQYLDIESEKGSEDLINLINIEILNKIGGNELVNAYKNKYYK